MDHVSIDCETLGVSTNNPAILSIGMVFFDPVKAKLGGERYFEIDVTNAIRHGHVDGDTLVWWMSQSSDSRKLFQGSVQKQLLRDALDAIGASIRTVGAPLVWFNGPGEDGAWLKSAYNSVGLGVPWQYYNQRDLRTIMDVAQVDRKDLPSTGTAHDALDDARNQARHIIYAYKKIEAALAGKKFVAPKIAAAKVVVEDDDEL